MSLNGIVSCTPLGQKTAIYIIRKNIPFEAATDVGNMCCNVRDRTRTKIHGSYELYINSETEIDYESLSSSYLNPSIPK